MQHCGIMTGIVACTITAHDTILCSEDYMLVQKACSHLTALGIWYRYRYQTVTVPHKVTPPHPLQYAQGYLVCESVKPCMQPEQAIRTPKGNRLSISYRIEDADVQQH